MEVHDLHVPERHWREDEEQSDRGGESRRRRARAHGWRATARSSTLEWRCGTAPGTAPARPTPSPLAMRRTNTTAATASVQAVSNGVGSPLPGVTTSASGTNHKTPSRGCASATTTQQSEVMEPDDRRQRKRGRDSDEECGALVPTPCEQRRRKPSSPSPNATQRARAASTRLLRGQARRRARCTSSARSSRRAVARGRDSRRARQSRSRPTRETSSPTPAMTRAGRSESSRCREPHHEGPQEELGGQRDSETDPRGRARSRKRHTIAAHRPRSNVTFPVWIADRTEGQRNTTP